MKKKTLPDDTATFLIELKKANTTRFYAHLLAMRRAGWPFSAFADVFNVSRVTISNWQSKAFLNEDAFKLSLALHVPKPPVDSYGSKVKKKKIVRDVPPQDREKIAKVAPLASKNTRWSRPDSPERRASEELDRLVQTYVVEKKVPATKFARYAGVTRRAIIQRIEKK